MAYYAIKAEANGLIDEAQRDGFIGHATGFVDLEAEMLLSCVIAKYRLRARPGNPKDNEFERGVVREILRERAAAGYEI